MALMAGGRALQARWSDSCSSRRCFLSPSQSAPLRLTEANWDSVLSCLAVSAEGWGWVGRRAGGGSSSAWRVKRLALLWPLSKHTIHSVLLQAKTMIHRRRCFLPSILQSGALIDWLIDLERIWRHTAQHLCCAHCMGECRSVLRVTLCSPCHVKCSSLHWNITDADPNKDLESGWTDPLKNKPIDCCIILFGTKSKKGFPCSY